LTASHFREVSMEVMVLGEERLVGLAEAVSCQCGWELRISADMASRAHIVTAKVSGELPVRVGFHVIPYDWDLNPRGSLERAASVWFSADSVEEAKALRNLGELRWLSYSHSLVQLALKPGYTDGDAAALRLRAS
jgi:hypothetical protein